MKSQVEVAPMRSGVLEVPPDLGTWQAGCLNCSSKYAIIVAHVTEEEAQRITPALRYCAVCGARAVYRLIHGGESDD